MWNKDPGAMTYNAYAMPKCTWKDTTLYMWLNKFNNKNEKFYKKVS